MSTVPGNNFLAIRSEGGYTLPMKAKLACLACALLLATPASAQVLRSRSESVHINFSLGDINFGGVFPFADGDNAFELGVAVLPFGVEFNRINLGLWFSPFNFFRHTFPCGNTTGQVSLANLGLYWNIMSGSFLYFGPFVSANYFFMDNGVRWNRYMFTAGMQGGVRVKLDEVNWPLFTAETGFRLIDNRSNAFVSVKVDFMPLLAILAATIGIAIGVAVGIAGSNSD